MNNIESKYKVGDRVRVKSIEWYNLNKDKHGEIIKNDITLVKEMSAYCGKKVEIEIIYSNGIVVLKGNDWWWRDWMLEDDLSTKEQQVLEQLERVQAELDKLRALCNSK